MKRVAIVVWMAMALSCGGPTQVEPPKEEEPVDDVDLVSEESHTEEEPIEPIVVERLPPATDPGCTDTVLANVVALDQPYTYNRFGAFNPIGMVYALRRDVVALDGSSNPGPGNARLRDGKRPRPLTLRVNRGECLEIAFTNWLAPSAAQGGPATREASIHVNGLQLQEIGADGSRVGNNADSLAEPGESRTYRLHADHEGTFLFFSHGALTGGQSMGGSRVLGLFGAVNVEPAGSRWYRSQVRADELEAVTTGQNPDGTPKIDYEAVDGSGVPILAMRDARGELVHGDLTAIIDGYRESTIGDTPTSRDQGQFREFAILFHDEIEVVQAFEELEAREDMHGVRDGMAINYGASGMGSEILAQRKSLGPAKDCLECKFEEFFLSSWANGDPALVLDSDATGDSRSSPFPDDPSNVYHSYLGDPVRFRNLHAGPKETHVFHLHAHQWLHSPSSDRSTYNDSQTIGPGSTFTYDINYGGGGNRNLTPGDAIFHCHLYPHFAQGMWSLWRVHDVFEDGSASRNLPDGEVEGGTPTPALVPLPRRGMAPMPTFTDTVVATSSGPVTRPAMPGYPFYIAALAGHRPPQPPLDVLHDGGLQRHLVTAVPPDGVQFGARGEFDVALHKVDLKLLPPDGTPAERSGMAYHAGRFPLAERLRTIYGWKARAYPAFTPEGLASQFSVNGLGPKRGAPYANPCPDDAKVRTYRAAYVQQDTEVNDRGWHDPQGRFAVLNEDVEATREGRRPIEPLYIRANSGECVVFEATNLVPSVLEGDDFQIFTPTDTIGQHIHLVKFDVTSSDGSANGFNYEDGTFSADEVNERIAAANAAGGAFIADGALVPGSTRQALRAKHNPYFPSGPKGAQTTVQRWWADPVLSSDGTDRTLRTVFTHDHFSPSSHQQHGLYGALVVEPARSRWVDARTGRALGRRADGGPTSWQANIENGSRSFREFTLAFADFAILYDRHGEPVNPPTFMEAALPVAVEHPEGVVLQELISAGDPGTMVINYRNEPIPLRIAKQHGPRDWRIRSGKKGDMAYAFSSKVHGDPSTPLLNVYEGDLLQIRLIQGAQEEQHVFSLNANRWLHEPSDPDSGWSNAQAIGISEHFEFVHGQGVEPTHTKLGGREIVDYLYQSTPVDDLWNGMWGILRAHHERTKGVHPLPNNRRPSSPGYRDASVCPSSAKRRYFTVHAITARDNLPGGRLVYNEQFDLYDPDAILFVRAEHLAAVRSGQRRPEPLILRAAAGECLKVKLINELPERLQKTPHWNQVPPITEGLNVNQVPMSSHVGLHPQLVQVDPNRGDGTNVGHNQRQTIKPGKKVTYRWYAGIHRPMDGIIEPVEFGVVNLRDMADVVNHGAHGAIGALVIEPEGAQWTEDPESSASAAVRYRDGDGEHTFREFVLVVQDEVPLHSDDPRFQSAELNSGTALRNISGADDAGDTGHKAFNYRTEPLWARLGVKPETPEGDLAGLLQADLLNSNVYGDAETPLFVAAPGEPLRIRIAHPSGHARQHAYTFHGAEWRHVAARRGSGSSTLGENEHSDVLGTQGGASVMRHWNILPVEGAGGLHRVEGDFLYQDLASFSFLDGLWGVIRVEEPVPEANVASKAVTP